MSEEHCDDIKPPACPMCGAETKLKKRLRNVRVDGDTCVFKCTKCGVEYPIVMKS